MANVQIHATKQTRQASEVDSELDDVDYVSGLSTLLVATIQEAKDRISQIEYVFCTQLYPHFQSKSRTFQKLEDEWKDRENDLLRQIETLRAEKQQTLEENHSLELKSVQLKGYELERMLKQKCTEVEEGMELQNKLLGVIQLKDSLIVDKEKQLKENEEDQNGLQSKLSDLEKRVDKLQDQLGEKVEEVSKGNELKENLFRKIEYQASEIMNNEKLMNDREEERKLLLAKLELLEQNVGRLQKELLTKNDEMEGYVREKKLLVAEVTGLEEKVNELMRSRVSEVVKQEDSCEKLHKKIESMTLDLLAEKKKYTDLTLSYKKLKSQHNYLRTKHGLTRENMLPPKKFEDGSDSLRNDQNPSTSHEIVDLVDQNQHVSAAACYSKKVKNQMNCNNNLEGKKGGKPIQETSLLSPTTIFPVAPNCPPTAKSAPVAGTKRPASCWVDTRSRQGQRGPDPHDDFLDTPLENIRGNLNKATMEQVPDVSVPNDVNLDSSDDETQDVNAVIRPQKQQTPVPVAGKNGFKFVEPVRKKAERENLKGVECKQCKKFYDAVLPNDDGGKGTDNNKHNFRCEHHEGVSRHRYRYAPPLTPEGFWNIGFESEM